MQCLHLIPVNFTFFNTLKRMYLKDFLLSNGALHKTFLMDSKNGLLQTQTQFRFGWALNKIFFRWIDKRNIDKHFNNIPDIGRTHEVFKLKIKCETIVRSNKFS